jgi:hypothetical protein
MPITIDEVTATVDPAPGGTAPAAATEAMPAGDEPLAERLERELRALQERRERLRAD